MSTESRCGRTSLHHRISRLSARLDDEPGLPITDEEFVAAFERIGAEGWLAHEPEFPQALAELRIAVATTRSARLHPDPPASFERGLPRIERWDRWRQRHPLLTVDKARARLAEMLIRLDARIPPVTVAEFEQLAAWGRANAGWVGSAGGSKMPVAELMTGIDRGAKYPGAGEVAQAIRKLRERFESEGRTHPVEGRR